jgi:hypothetical protein
MLGARRGPVETRQPVQGDGFGMALGGVLPDAGRPALGAVAAEVCDTAPTWSVASRRGGQSKTGQGENGQDTAGQVMS